MTSNESCAPAGSGSSSQRPDRWRPESWSTHGRDRAAVEGDGTSLTWRRYRGLGAQLDHEPTAVRQSVAGLRDSPGSADAHQISSNRLSRSAMCCGCRTRRRAPGPGVEEDLLSGSRGPLASNPIRDGGGPIGARPSSVRRCRQVRVRPSGALQRSLGRTSGLREVVAFWSSRRSGCAAFSVG